MADQRFSKKLYENKKIRPGDVPPPDLPMNGPDNTAVFIECDLCVMC